jgi:hypothetical protein
MVRAGYLFAGFVYIGEFRLDLLNSMVREPYLFGERGEVKALTYHMLYSGGWEPISTSPLYRGRKERGDV